jgi:hypothetical protein
MTRQPTPADLRGQAAREMVARAQSAPLELVVLSGMELCVLGAPEQVLCEEKLAAAWLGYSERRRRKAMDLTTEALVKRGLLLEQRGAAPGPASGPAPDGAPEATPLDGAPADGAARRDTTPEGYAMDPALGLVLAARSRPAFVVVTALDGAEARTPRMYALGDEQEPVRAVVVEVPEAAPPGDFPHLDRMGALGRLYRYVLMSRDTAADWLARWADQPAPDALRAKNGRLPPRLVSVYRHDEGRDLRGFTVAFRHDGGRAQLLEKGAPDGEVVGAYDRDGVRGIMSDLLVLGR